MTTIVGLLFYKTQDDPIVYTSSLAAAVPTP